MNAKKITSKTKTPGKSLERLATQANEAAPDTYPDPFLPPESLDDRSFARALHGVPVSTIVATVMILATLSRRERSRVEGSRPLAMVVSVPASDWLNPVMDAICRARRWDKTFKRAGDQRTQDKPENGNDTVAEALGEGGSVLWVSTSPERYLPSALVAAADVRLTLGAPSTRTLRWVIRTVTGRAPDKLPAGLAQGLTISEIASCIRRGTGATACVRRLEAATASKRADADQGLVDVPLLEDCLGYGQAKEWGLQLVAALDEYRRGERPFSSIEDRNIVLAGDAGVGKTSFARSLAKSAGIPLIATSVSQWFASTGGYLNDIVKAVDAVFGQAIAQGPAVLLLDEIDSVPDRATCDSRHRDYWVPIVSHILLALDSAVSGASARLIVIGATNFPTRLDQALVRPGRLNRIVMIERPDVPALAGIMRQHLGGALDGEDLMPLAAIAHGATGAEAAGWARGARMTARAAGRSMVMADLVGQIALPETRSPAELLGVARHEAGHCLATETLLVGTLTTVSLVARGAFGGRTSAKLREACSMSADELDALIVSVLAGRACDEHWGGIRSGSAGGPGSDLASATALTAGKHACWGLGGSLLYRGDQVEALNLLRIDPFFRKTVEADLDRLYGVARDLIRRNAAMVDRIARRLVAKRIMSGDEVREIIGAPASGAGEDGAVATVGGPHE